MPKKKSLLGPMRANFLILTPACVLLGCGSAMWESGHINIFYAVLILVGAISAHISVNTFNEYYDFKSGLDLRTERTPFSGGTGTLPERPDLASSTLYTAWITLVITALIGVYFVWVRGLALLPLGILGLVIIPLYTTRLNYNPFLCLISPGLGFGPLMVMGTHFVLTGNYSVTAFIASLVPFFLVNNLLLLNQYPDVNADKSVGRRHFPILIGLKGSTLIYGSFLLFTYLSIVLGVYYAYLPEFSLIGLLTIVLAIPAFVGAYRYSENIKKLIPYMGINVIINILTPVLVAVGLFIT
jgi:1,4-dihydroxy-2-naphthoate octaprenyltransferase